MQNEQNSTQPLVAPESEESGICRADLSRQLVAPTCRAEVGRRRESDEGRSVLAAAETPSEGGSTADSVPLSLRLFTQPDILQQIDPRRINKILRCFADDFTAAGITLPDHELLNGEYHSAVGRLLAGHLPAPLRAALLTLENAAAPENQARTDESIHRRIPCIAVNQQCPIDRALDLFFLVPDELAQFQPPAEAPSTNIQTPVKSQTPSSNNLGGESSVEHPASPNLKPATSNLQLPSSQPLTGSLTHSLTTSTAPWPFPVDGKLLLDDLAAVLRRFVVLPIWAAEALALWIVHTFAFQLRDVSVYIGIESPEKRCGKTTLLTLVSQLVNRPVVASNISPPAFFRVIEELRPTLLIDEADTFLRGNDELRGILNAGNKRETAFVVRVANQAAMPLRTAAPAPSTINTPTLNSVPLPLTDSLTHPLTTPSSPLSPDTRHSTLATYSTWCPKMMAAIGHLPETLADRCIVIRMQRKTAQENCERLRNLDAEPLRRKCARFVADHSAVIATAHPEMPAGLNDRATDIWEPLVAIADLAGGKWPELARQAAVSLTSRAQDQSPIGSLLLDLFVIFALDEADRHFTRNLVAQLNHLTDRPWNEMRKGKQITEAWLSQCLRPYGVRSRTMRIGTQQAKGFFRDDLMEVFRRYLPKSELQALVADQTPADLPRQNDSSRQSQTAADATAGNAQSESPSTGTALSA